MKLCEAIARQEGWLVAASRCRRNQNPGNLRAGAFAARHGATGQDSEGFAIFATDTDGFRAMAELLEAKYEGLTVRQAIMRYAPPVENNSERYIADMCAWTGLAQDHILTAADFA